MREVRTLLEIMTKHELIQVWLTKPDAIAPTVGIPVGASVFEEWLEAYLYSRAAMMIQYPVTSEALEARLHEIRKAEITAHNALRPRDVHWQRDIEFRREVVTRIVNEAKPHLILG